MTGSALDASVPVGTRRLTLRAATRRLTSGVAVLACDDGATAHALTVSTLALASFEPPMVSVALRRDGRGLAALLAAPSFAVNVLAAGQQPLARRFADPMRPPGIGRPDDWVQRQAGPPLLVGAAGWLACRFERLVPAGDHALVLAAVVDVLWGQAEPLSTAVM